MTTLTTDIMPVCVEDEMKKSYLDYAMSVIVSRALPDVRDGLKPVHRRILFSMYENGYEYNKPFRKSARIVGDVMGKYHPHGDSAIYEAMVRMAQPFSMRVPLISSQGNFGSMDGDKAAAMRYTEARLGYSSHWLLEDIDKDTVDFRPNYDESCSEPVVLPARFPNLLVNGSGGIAVGMATNIAPHNLGEVLDACIAIIDNPDITCEELHEIVPAPDFPTGGIILGRGASRSAALTGRGSIIVRGRCSIEEIKKDKQAIIITEIPYQVNKAAMIQRMAELVKEKVIEGISDLRDESDREGVRVVVELKREAQAEVVLNQLYKYTPLQSSFPVNSLALNGGRPEVMNLEAILRAFIAFREEVIRRRTIYNLNKSRDRAHLLVGLAIAVANIDKVIEMIKTSPDPAVAKRLLMETRWGAYDVEPLIELIDEPDRKVVNGCYFLSEAQARGILELKLQRLTGLERDKIHAEVGELSVIIKDLLDILASHERLYGIMRDEFVKVKDEFATPRLTTIEDVEFEQDIEDLIPREDMIITVTSTGYIKRVPLSTYRAQHRGGKGRSGTSLREEDQVIKIFPACTHDPILFFSNKGMVYKMKAYRLPEGSPQSLGKALINLLPLEQDEKITTMLTLPEKQEDCKDLSAMFATSSGNIRRSRLDDFYNVNSNGKIAMKLDEGDKLVDVQICREDQDILISSSGGRAIRFPVETLRIVASRSSIGVRGMKLGKDEEVVSMSIIDHAFADTEKRDAYLKMAIAKRRAMGTASEEDTFDAEEGDTTENTLLSAEEFEKMETAEQFILTVTQSGYGKRSSAYAYRITNRGGIGVTNTSSSRGKQTVVASFPVSEDENLMLVTDTGKLIRMKVSDIRIAGRATVGVILFRMDKDEKVVSVSTVKEYEELPPENDEEGTVDAVSETAGEAVVNASEEISDESIEKENENA